MRSWLPLMGRLANAPSSWATSTAISRTATRKGEPGRQPLIGQGPLPWTSQVGGGRSPRACPWVPKDGTKKARGNPRHLDVVLASGPAVAVLDPRMVAIGTDSEIDTP